MNVKQLFRARILGDSTPLPRANRVETWVEVADTLAPPVLPAADEVKVPQITVVQGGQRYFNENFVRGKIENWAGRPAGGQRDAFVPDEETAARFEVRAESCMPVDHTDADVTARTLASMPDRVVYVLIMYHTSQRTIAQISKECHVCIGTCHADLVRGHSEFTTRWEDERHKLNAELRSLAPVIDPSLDAVPVVPLPRDKPAIAPVTISRDPRQC